MTPDFSTIDGQPVNMRRIKWLASAALVLFGIFAVIIILFHFLRWEYDPYIGLISEYAVGPYGVVMSLAFISLGIGSFLLVAALYLGISNGGRSMAGLISLSAWALCVCIAGMFNTNVHGTEQTIHSQMHDNILLVAFIVIIIGSFLLLRFRRDDNWQPYYQMSFIISILMLLAFADFIISLIIRASLAGIVQRVFIAIVLVWLIATARRLLSF